jgi:hypothetical protein
MSLPILPYAVWQSGTNENSIPANDNSLRNEILHGEVIADDVTAQPVSPARGDVYIIPAGATGAQWSTFDADDLAIYDGGTWHAYAPVAGLVVHFLGSQKQYTGTGGWVDFGGGSSGPAPVVTEAGTARAAAAGDAGDYTRFTNASPKTYTFDAAAGFSVGAEFHGRNVGAGALTIVEAGGMVIHEPASGSLVIPSGGTFTVKIVASGEADLFGVTELAS